MRLDDTPPSRAARLCAATAIGASSALVLLALSHHPVGPAHATAQDSLAALAAMRRVDGVVHGALLLMLAALAAGFTVFGELLGARRPLVRLAHAAYGLGCCALVAAALLDGFATPRLASQFAAASSGAGEVAIVALRAYGTAIGVFSEAGLLAMCAALLAWSYALWQCAPALPWARRCACIGMLAGLPPAAYIVFSGAPLAPANLIAIFVLHGVWNGAAALMLAQVRYDRS